MGTAAKTLRGIILVLAMTFFAAALLFMPAATVEATEPIAIPIASPVWVDGQSIPFDAYNIEGNNYFKLRDLAFTLDGGPKSFDISFDDSIKAVMLTTNHPYTPAGGEMAARGGSSITPLFSDEQVFLDGLQIFIASYIIEGSTYFKLRDIAQALDFAVDWNEQSGSILIDTSQGYGHLLVLEDGTVPLAQLPTINKELGGQELGSAPNEAVLGAPSRVINDGAGGQIRIYGDYSHFTLLCVSGGQVVYIYLNYDIYNQQADKLFTDNVNGGKPYAAATGNMPAYDAQTSEQLLFELTNAFRCFSGLSDLRWNDTLQQAARKHSQDMAQHNYFSHQGLDGATVGGRLDKAEYKWTACAENIAAGYQYAFEALDVLINSASHRKNLLTTNCDETGVGWVKYEQGKYSYYVTQLFGKV